MMPMNRYAKASFQPVNKCGAALGNVMRRTSCTRTADAHGPPFASRAAQSRPASAFSIMAGAANIPPIAISSRYSNRITPPAMDRTRRTAPAYQLANEEDRVHGAGAAAREPVPQRRASQHRDGEGDPTSMNVRAAGVMSSPRPSCARVLTPSDLGAIMVSGPVTPRRHSSSMKPTAATINATRVQMMPRARVMTQVVPSPSWFRHTQRRPQAGGDCTKVGTRRDAAVAVASPASARKIDEPAGRRAHHAELGPTKARPHPARG